MSQMTILGSVFAAKLASNLSIILYRSIGLYIQYITLYTVTNLNIEYKLLYQYSILVITVPVTQRRLNNTTDN